MERWSRTPARPGGAPRGRRILLALALPAAVALLATPAAAHPEALVPQDFWRAWTLDPWVLAGIGLPAWLYGRGLRALWGRAGVGRGVRTWQARCFLAGTLALIVALVSPLDALGGTLFSAHMLQHVVLMMVAAPLLALGAPLVPWLWALPRGSRVRLGAWAKAPVPAGLWGAASHPLGAWLLHAAAIWVWHAPVLYQATLRSEAVHVAQHLSFFGTAMLFWWTAFELSRRRRRKFGVGVLFVFTTAVHSSVLGALLTFSLVLWYPAYAPLTAAWGLTPLEDQQLGGLIMWVPAGLVYVAATLALLAVGLGLGEPERRRGPGLGGGLPVRPVLPEPLPRPEGG
jgi:putative membrane protein